ncbi:Complement component C1q domain [Mactra antiquata]
MDGRYLIVVLFLCFVPSTICDDTFEKRLLALEKVIQIQREEIDELKRENILVKSEVNYLKRENVDIKSQVNDLQQQLRDYIKTESNVYQRTQETVQISDSAKEMPVNVESIHNSTFYNTARNTRNVRRQLNAEAPIAFYAVINGQPCIHDHEVVVFNQEITDEGNGYNPNDGIYIVPTSGLYVFTWTTASRDDWYVSELVINGVGKAHAFTDTGNEPNVSQATGIAIIRVATGDHVFVRKVIGRGCDIHDAQYRLTSFSGWLLY